MKTYNTNYTTPNFTARAPKLRKADDICRIIAREFSAVSGTRITEFNSVSREPKFQKYINKVNYIIRKGIREPVNSLSFKNQHLDAILTLINNVKKYRFANCNEFANLCSLICRMNGMDVIIPRLYKIKNKEYMDGLIDHAVLMLKPKKNVVIEKLTKMHDTIIIDPWLGFADFAPNVEKRFKTDYAKIFEIGDNGHVALSTYGDEGLTADENILKTLREMFPQFLLNQKQK